MSRVPFPAVHSALSPAALADLLRADYDLGLDVTVTFLRRGLNDTYDVRWNSRRAALRVYRHGWRTAGDIAWELAFIERAAARGVGMARPISRRDGALFSVLHATEGERPCVLFEFAPGRMPEPVAKDAALYGRTVAALHTATDGLNAGGRFPLDLSHLIRTPLAHMRPLLTAEPELWRAIEATAERTLAALAPLLPGLEWGPCHGDLHEGNAHLGPDGTLRLFDVDCGGPGWRAYDLAVYQWRQASRRTRTQEQENAAWTVFLDAYLTERSLADADLAAIPLFVTARSLWILGLYSEQTGVAGTQSLDDTFFRNGLAFMQGWAARA
ncbi:phosphotransferase [Deinococcus sp.]|uniref:phosphotransferase enzyme family protein n=1 Tax=Deinococcus sp. TaxID=47478 RepID=UPI002869EB4F|nr:phosphotransferase [Deinococcus sp.]